VTDFVPIVAEDTVNIIDTTAGGFITLPICNETVVVDPEDTGIAFKGT